MRAWLAYITVAIVWGSTYVAIAETMESFTPLGVAPARFLPAALIAWLIGRARREPALPRAAYPHLAVSGLILLSGANALVCWGETTISSGMAAVLTAMTPLFLVVLQRRRLSGLAMLGMAFGLGGVVVLTEPWTGNNDPTGVGVVLLGSVCWAVGTLYARKHLTDGSYATQAAVQMFCAGLFGLAAAPLVGGYTHAPVATDALWATAYLVVFGSVIAFIAHGYLIRAWPPARAQTYAFINPVVAVALGSILRDEALGPQIGLGTALCLIGVWLVQFFGRKN